MNCYNFSIKSCRLGAGCSLNLPMLFSAYAFFYNLFSFDGIVIKRKEYSSVGVGKFTLLAFF